VNTQRTDKLYHIYAKQQCIYHSLSEKEFKEIWDTINKFVSLTAVIDKDDLSYEEVTVEKDLIQNASY